MLGFLLVRSPGEAWDEGPGQDDATDQQVPDVQMPDGQVPDQQAPDGSSTDEGTGSSSDAV